MASFNTSEIKPKSLFKKTKWAFWLIIALVLSGETLANIEKTCKTANPLLEDLNLPKYDKILPEHFKPAVIKGIEEHKATIEQLLSQEKYTWDNFVIPLDEAYLKLILIWETILHLNSVTGNEEVKKSYEESLPLLTKYFARVDQNEKIFNAIERISNNEEYKNFDSAQKKILKDKLRDFHLAGVALSSEKKKRFVHLKQKLDELGNKFTNNVLGAAQNYEFKITEKGATGLPESSITLGKKSAEKKNQEGLIFTLDLPSYGAFITYSDSRKLREKICKDYLTRASDKGYDEKWDNTAIIKKILEIRKELSNMLSFDNFAEYSIAKKMAKSSEEVTDLLYDIAKKLKPKAEEELKELQKLAAKDGVDKLEPWDIGTSWRYSGYYVEKLKQKKTEISQEDLSSYFPVPHVLEGLFEIMKRLYSVTFVENKNIPAWHKDVKFFEIYNNKNKLQGYIYIDLYYRDHKDGGAWMNGPYPRHVTKDGEIKLPVTYLVCNFAPPTKDKPSLLTHYQLLSLLHEMGHCMQHFLSNIDYISASGLRGIPRDGVEVASKFMENWGWYEESLRLLSKHYQNGEPLPKSIIRKLLDNGLFQVGINTLYQIEFSLIDLIVHLEQATTMEEFEKITAKIQEQIRVAPAYKHDRLLHYFTHIFHYNYAAGYYSYLWSEIIASDLFSKFAKQGILNRKIGEEFLHKYLEAGGSEDPYILFENFLGRKTRPDAFLQSCGIFVRKKNFIERSFAYIYKTIEQIINQRI